MGIPCCPCSWAQELVFPSVPLLPVWSYGARVELTQVSGDRGGRSSKGTVSVSVNFDGVVSCSWRVWQRISFVLPLRRISCCHHTDQPQEVQKTGRGSRSQTGCPLDRVLWLALPNPLLRRMLMLSLRKSAPCWEGTMLCVWWGCDRSKKT